MDKLKLCGKRIKELRKKNNMTQEQLAVKLCVYQKQIGNIETATCFTTFQTLEKLANVFNVDIEELFRISHLNSREEIINDINTLMQNAKDTDLKIIQRVVHSILQ